MSNSLKVLAAPVAVLLVSILIAPWVTEVRDLADPAALPTTPAVLYRRARTTFHYTTADLRTPQTIGAPGRYAEAIVFDVLPAGEQANVTNDDVMWVQLFWSAIAGGPRPGSVSDVSLANRFRETIGLVPRKPRGTASVFELPGDSQYRAQTGIRALAALAIRIPDQVPPARVGAPQMFEDALRDAFRQLKRAGLRSAGIPRLTVRGALGDPGSRYQSWQRILEGSDHAAPGSGMRGVLFGAWALAPGNRTENDGAFRLAWQQHRKQLELDARAIAHEHVRLAALIAFAALLTWHLRGSALTWRRALALVLASAALAPAIMKGGAWVLDAFHPAIGLLFAGECAVALLAGAFIEFLVTFDYRKAIATTEDV